MDYICNSGWCKASHIYHICNHENIKVGAQLLDYICNHILLPKFIALLYLAIKSFYILYLSTL